MKAITNIIMICLVAYSISSCTSQKVTIKGTPGTEIYIPAKKDEYKKIGVIEDDGKTKIKIKKKNYHPFLIAYDIEKNNYYPIGLDYKYKRFYWRNFWWIPAIIPTLYISEVIYLQDYQAHEGYEYLDVQSININRPNAPYANTGERRKVKGSKKASSSLLSKSSSSSSHSSKLLRTNYGKQLQGEYTGNGKLLQGNSTIERYSNMTINITPVDKNSVSVKVLMDGSEEVLAPCNYKIGNQGDNYFVLTSEDDESAIIEIKNSKAVYNNPNVNIDGEIYNLQITAEKE